MKKLLTSLVASTLLLSVADARVDFYQGWEGGSTTFSSSSDRDVFQKGIGFGARFYTELVDQVDIGLEAGMSHIETHGDIGGNLLRASFVLKYHFTDWFEVYVGLGVGYRGMPDTNYTTDSVALTGGGWNIGTALESDGGWRVDAGYYGYSYTGTIDNVSQSIDTSLFGVHFGKSFDIR